MAYSIPVARERASSRPVPHPVTLTNTFASLPGIYFVANKVRKANSVFCCWRKNSGAQDRRFWHSSYDICSAHFVKILSPQISSQFH